MPLKEPKLPEATVAKIARWIDLGAPSDRPLVEKSAAAGSAGLVVTDRDREFWSCRPLSAPAVPAVCASRHHLHLGQCGNDDDPQFLPLPGTPERLSRP